MKKHSYLTKTLSVFLSLLMVMTSVVVGNPLGLGLEASAAETVVTTGKEGLASYFTSSETSTTRLDRVMLTSSGAFDGDVYLRLQAKKALKITKIVASPNSV